MTEVCPTLELASAPPEVEEITAYDRTHFAIYLSLLYAIGEGEHDAEIARKILRIDPEQEPERAMRVLSSHLKRARWLAENGYHLLLED